MYEAAVLLRGSTAQMCIAPRRSDHETSTLTQACPAQQSKEEEREMLTHSRHHITVPRRRQDNWTVPCKTTAF